MRYWFCLLILLSGYKSYAQINISDDYNHHMLKINFFQYLMCEPNLVYEYRPNRNFGLELTLGTYFNPARKKITFFDNDYDEIPTSGVVGRINPKIYMGKSREFYLSPMLLLKQTKYVGVIGNVGKIWLSQRPYDWRVNTTEKKKIIQGGLLFGYQKIIDKRYLFDVYTGLGVRYKYIDYIYTSKFSESDYDPCDGNYPCGYDEERVWPSLHLGMKLGYILQPMN